MKQQIGLAGWINSKEVKMFRKDTLNTYNPFAIVIGISVLGLLVLLSAVAGPIAADWPSGAGESVALGHAAVYPEQAAYVKEHGSIVKLTSDAEPVARYEGSIAALTGRVEGFSERASAAWMGEIPKDFGSLAALTGQIEAAPRYEGSLAVLTGLVEEVSGRRPVAWMNEIPKDFGSLAALTGQIEAAPRYEGSLAALTGLVEELSGRHPAAWMGEIPEGFGALVRVTGWISAAPRYEGSLAALTGLTEPVAKFEGSLVELTGPGRSERMSQSEYEKEFGPIVKITG